MTGLIFGVIAVCWIAYLLPWFLSHRDQPTMINDDDVDQFAASMRLIRSSEPVIIEDNPDLEFSTPLMRNAMRVEVARAARTAAKRRRVGLLVHLMLLGFGIAAPFALPVSPWVIAAPAAALVLFLILSRASVKIVGRRLDARLAIINHGWDEETVTISIADLTDELNNEMSIELSGPIGGLGSLLEPLPVTPATYVSKPLVPRSVRTIDLSAPVAPASVPNVPVTVDAPAARLGETDDQLPRAVGE